MHVFISCSSWYWSLMFDLGEVQENIMSSAPQNWFEMQTQIE